MQLKISAGPSLGSNNYPPSPTQLNVLHAWKECSKKGYIRAPSLSVADEGLDYVSVLLSIVLLIAALHLTVPLFLY